MSSYFNPMERLALLY